MALARTPFGPNCTASDFVSAITAPLLAVYASCGTDDPTRATKDAMLMTEPPPARISSGMPCLQHSARPRTLIAMVRSQICSDMVSTDSSAWSKTPALLYRTFRDPNRSTAVRMIRWTSASLVTSPVAATALSPRSPTVSCTASALTSTATTRAPSRTNTWVATRPIPPPAPVMSATLPSSRPISPPL